MFLLYVENVCFKSEDAGEEVEKSARQCAVSIQQHAESWRQRFVLLTLVSSNVWTQTAVRVVTHFILCDEGEGGDAGPSDTSAEHAKSPSAEHAKTPQQPGGWVRGHQKSGGGYTREMPRSITGKAIVQELVF